MNKLKGKITEIESTENMSLVRVDVAGDIFSAVVLETPVTAAYLQRGREISVIFKETEVSLAKGLSGMISLRNRQRARVKEVSKSKILSQVVLDYKSQPVVSVISTQSVEEMDLKSGDEVEWLVKTNEISLWNREE